ncbi:hypothetical protein BQ8794_280052 [Mesorhizobium prunaredense]|uniref:Uncharacterized protein n=1 Tax=Mesorhizobium prunaredense TaxID=1631249 RepID=A0A1R3VAM7_9HYPH|nr:hypothetical protein BQ8794_280052 [Mesorhizobium prunaredense]
MKPKKDLAPHMDETPLLPGSLGLNRDWTILKAQRRVAGGEPINFYKGRAKSALYADYEETRDALDRTYRRDALDHSGVPESEPGEWMTVSEYAKSKDTGPRKAREVMEGLGILQQEIEVRLVPLLSDPRQTKPNYRTTSRLASWAVGAGFGRRMKSGAGVPYDVLSPDGMAWLNARWLKPVEKPEVKRGRPSTLRGEVQHLLAEGKTQADIARLLGKSRQIVSHHVKVLKAA